MGMERRIALLACDSTKLPFREGIFDVVVSFLALQDIKSTKGKDGVLLTVNEACRSVKKNGTVAIADDSFPCCKPKGDQGMLFNAIKQYWHNLLPSTISFVEAMKKNGICQVKVLSYDSKEGLLPRDAERELKLSVDSAKSLGVKVDFASFWKEVGEVVKKKERTFPQIILLLGIKT
jgi:hypothetical protein